MNLERDFGYLGRGDIYLDTACQSLRPQSVIDALNEYYTEYGSCGERVKYKWGKTVDEKIEAVRADVLKWLKLSPKEYFVSFTLNTTYGLNLILSQIKVDSVKKVYTSDIEHNSAFLPTIALAKRAGCERVVLERNEDGSIDVSDVDFSGAVCVFSCVSNIDGRKLENMKEVVRKVRQAGGMVIIDAAQAMAHHHETIEKCEADAICFSAHKMYAPSLGVMVVRKSLLRKMEIGFIGGGMVDDVWQDRYKLSADDDGHVHTAFEAGLQAWGEIIALGEAIKWISAVEKSSRIKQQSERLFEFLQASKGVKIVNHEASPVISFYHEKIDSHLLASGLSNKGIMARSGYFCCHYYLDKVKKLPPLLRFSLGYHNRDEDIDETIKVLERVFK